MPLPRPKDSDMSMASVMANFTFSYRTFVLILNLGPNLPHFAVSLN